MSRGTIAILLYSLFLFHFSNSARVSFVTLYFFLGSARRFWGPGRDWSETDCILEGPCPRTKQKGGTFDSPIYSLMGSRAALRLLAPALDR